MKKIFGFKRRKKEAPPDRGASDSVVSAVPAAPTGPAVPKAPAPLVFCSYTVRNRNLPKIHKAAAAGDLPKLKQLALKSDLNQLDRCNRTPLHLACANGWTDVVTFLVDRKCNVNICDNNNYSPLMKAIQCKQESCANYLLEHGADPNLVDANGNSALHLAASTGNISIAQKLIEHHAHIDIHNKNGSTPLLVAVTENNQEMLEFLLQKGASIHAKDNVGRTPLLSAASFGNHELVKLLLQRGADISNKDYTGLSTEDYAIYSGDATLRYKLTEYANCQNTEVSPPASKKDQSLCGSPGKDAGFSVDAPGDAGFSLGAPATNKEEIQQSVNQIAGDSVKVVDYLSSGDSLRHSGKTDDDSWLSSEEEELEFNPKKPQKPSLVQLMNIARLKKEIFEKSSVNSSQQNRSDCEVEDLSESSLPMSQVKSFPHPVHSSPGSFSKHSQMASRLRSEQSSKGNLKVEAEKSISPNNQEMKDPDDSLASSVEEEFEDEGDEEEEEDDSEEEEEEEDVGEEGEDFSQEGEDDSIEESQNQLKNEEEGYFKKSDEREKLFEAGVYNECGENKANQNLVGSNEICNTQDEEMKKAGDMQMSFIAGHYECSGEKAAFNIPNDEQHCHLLEKGNNHEKEKEKEFQNTYKFKDTEENNITPGRHRSCQVCSSETVEGIMLSTAFSFALKNHNKKGRNSNQGDIFESDDDHGSDLELEKYKTKEQNSTNPIPVNNLNIREQQCMDSQDLETATHEPLEQESGNSEEENLKETFQTNIKEEEDHDEDKEAGAVSGVLDKSFNSKSQGQRLLHDGGIPSKVGKCKKEDENARSLWDSECPGSHGEAKVEATSGNSEKSLGFLLSSPAKASTHINYLSTSPTTHMHIISEEPCDGNSYGSQMKTVKTNEEPYVSVSHLLKGLETKEHLKSALMEELGLGDADIEDETDWDSTSVSLKSMPSNKSVNVLAMKDRASLIQLTKQDAISKTSETLPVKGELSNAHIMASTAQQGNRQVTPKLERGKNEDKNVIDPPKRIEKPSPENKTDKAKVLFTCDKKKTNPEILNEESNNDHSMLASGNWEERYEKMWVAKEKREVKTNFKSITAELKQLFGEYDVSQKRSQTPVEERSQDGFTGVSKSTNELPLPKPSKPTIGIPGKGDFGDLMPVVAEKEGSPKKSTLRVQRSVSQKVRFKQSEHDKRDGQQFCNTNDDRLSKSAESIKTSRDEKSNDAVVQSETDDSRKTAISKKRPNCLPPIRKNIVSKATFNKQPMVIANADVLFNVSKSPSPEILFHFNNGVSRGSSISTCKDNKSKIGNKMKPCPQSCYQISKKELDEELEHDVARFKNEVGMLQIVFLALEGKKVQLQKEVDEEKRKQKMEKSEATGKGDDAESEKELAVNVVEKKKEQKLSINELQPFQTQGNMIEVSPVNATSSVERPELIPVFLKGTNLADSMDSRKSENKRWLLKQRASQQFTENLHQLQDESSLSEPSLEEERKGAINGKKKICRSSDTDDLTQSSDTANTEDLELPKSVYKEAVLMIDQLSLNSTDSINLLKIQNIFKGYERLIEREKGRCARLHGKVKKLEKEKKEHQSMLEEMKEMKSMLDHNKMEQEGDISALKFSLKQEEEKRMSTEILYRKNQEQLRKKEEQYCQQVEEKQQLELTLRTLEMELKTLKTHLKEAEEERNEVQRLLSQEQNARALQEGILNTHLWRQKEIEEESKKKLSKSSEMGDGHDQEKELLQKNKKLQDELSLVRLELDQLKIQHQEEAAKYLGENEVLKEKNEELKKELKINEEALTQTVFQYNGQINLSKAESAMLTSKLERINESKERMAVELDSFHSRLNSALQELERCQISKTDLERIMQRERDDWLHLKDRLNHDLSNLKETNNTMSQQLGKAESKANSLENELHLTTLTLREKNLLLDSLQRDLSQAQSQVKELENTRQVEKDLMNKYVVKQDTMQERLAQLQSENLLLRQQFEDLQNKGLIKEKVVSDVQDKFTDMFGKLRADSEKQVEMMEERNKELVTTCNNLREQLFKYETEKVERESVLRQLQQELADSLKKQSMSEASLEVTTRYRSDLEDEKQQLQKEIERLKCKLQESEDQYIQSERRACDLRNSFESKEHEASVAVQKLQDLLVASSGTSNTVKQLEEHIQRLEIENARLEATTKQQTGRIEILQKDLKNSTFVHNRLEELITGLQTAKINLEEQLSHQVQKQTMLSATAQDTHNMWEEELKSRSELGVRLTELDREKAELASQLEHERKRMKKVLDLKRSVEQQLDQEIKRNSELQKECNGIRKLLKIAKKKIKESESDSSSPTSFKREIKDRYSEIDTEVGKLRKKIDELSYQLEVESTRRTQVESANFDLREQLSSMKLLHRSHEKLEKSKLRLEEEVADLKRHVHGNMMDHNQIEQYKKDIEERARQEIKQKLEEVNLFLQKQAASQETLEQIRATNNDSLKNQLEHRIKDLECELARLKSNQQDNYFQKESTFMELERYKGLYTEELKRRKTVESKLDRANEKLAESNAKLLHERHKSSSLLANTLISGSLSTNPVLETVQLGNLGTNLGLNRSLNLGGGLINPNITTVSSKDSIEAYLAKMRVELEKSITRELQQATTEIDAAPVRISPIGSNEATSRNLNLAQVSKAKQDYLDVLKKRYML